MRKKSHAFSDAIGQKPTLIIYTQKLYVAGFCDRIVKMC